jgi:O-antigen/teichoic acid export membrane protein
MDAVTIFKNSFYQLFARSSTTLVGFLITLLIARYFGADGYGDFTKIISLVTLFYLIIDFGLNAAFVRDKVHSFGNLLYSRIGVAFFLFLGLNIGVYFLPFNPLLNTGFSETVKFGILIFSLSFFNQAIIFSTAALFQKKLSYKYFMLAQSLGAVFNFILILILIKFSFSLTLVISSMVLSGVFSSVLSLIFAKEKPVFITKFPKDLFVVSLPLAAMLIFNLIYFKIDAIILSFFKPSADVGVYGLSYRIFEFLITIPLFFSNSIYPALIAKKEKKNEFMSFFLKYRIIFLGMSLFISTVGWGLAPLLSLINPDFTASILPFRILVLSLPLFFITSIYQWGLITLKKQKALMYIYFLNALINIGLNLIFIPRYSYLASSAITVLCEAVVAVFLILYFHEYFPKGNKKE